MLDSWWTDTSLLARQDLTARLELETEMPNLGPRGDGSGTHDPWTRRRCVASLSVDIRFSQSHLGSIGATMPLFPSVPHLP